MQRRSAIRNLAVITGGILFLPSCKSTPGMTSVALKNIKIDAAQEKLLAKIASIIIPATDTLGAKEVGAHLFALKMLDDMYEKEVQQDFITGLEQLENDTKKQFDRSFIDCAIQQKQKVLLDIINKKGDPREALDFPRWGWCLHQHTYGELKFHFLNSFRDDFIK